MIPANVLMERRLDQPDRYLVRVPGAGHGTAIAHLIRNSVVVGIRIRFDVPQPGVPDPVIEPQFVCRTHPHPRVAQQLANLTRRTTA